MSCQSLRHRWCGKNESGRVTKEWSTEISPPGVSPSATGFTPQVGIYYIVTGLNLRPSGVQEISHFFVIPEST